MEKEKELTDEVERLRLEIKELKDRKSAFRKGVSSITYRLIIGSSLKNSLEKLFNEVPDKVSKATLAEVVAALIRRFSRVWLLGLLFASIPILQTVILHTQSQLIEEQNKRVQEQSELLEASRRSSLVLLMSELMNVIDRELRSSTDRTLSPQTISRIGSLTRSLKPYKYLAEDGLIKAAYSPERGQLLVFLVNASIDTISLRSIFDMSDFSKSDLKGANLEDAYLEGVNLQEANLADANLSNSNLMFSKLSGAVLTDSDCYFTNFSYSQLVNADLSGADLRKSLLYKTEFQADLLKKDLEPIVNIPNGPFKGKEYIHELTLEELYQYQELADSLGWFKETGNVSTVFKVDYVGVANLENVIVDLGNWIEFISCLEVIGVVDIKREYIVDTTQTTEFDNRGVRLKIIKK